MDFVKLGQVYKFAMNDVDRAKAVASKTTQTRGGKKTVGICVGAKAGRKTLYLTAAEFADFEKGFAA